jgi:hypothetical protein
MGVVNVLAKYKTESWVHVNNASVQPMLLTRYLPIQYSRTEIRTIVKKVMVNSFEAFKSSREV